MLVESTCRRDRKARGSAERGFTLVELLVVVAVIGLLLGILVPTLGAARMRAGVIKDLCNLRQLGMVSAAVAFQRQDELVADMLGGIYMLTGLPGRC